MNKERILIVDDEHHIVRLCTRLLNLQGYTTEGTTSGREALARLEAEAGPDGQGFHLLVVDIKMPDVDGLAVLRRGRELDPHLRRWSSLGMAHWIVPSRPFTPGRRGS